MTPRRCTAIAPFILALAVASCAAQNSRNAEPLDAAGIEQAIVGHTLTRRGGPLLGRWFYAGLHRTDGTMTARVEWAGGEERASGTWETTAEGLYCRNWSNRWADGERGCFRVSRAGAMLFFDHVSGAAGDADRYRYERIEGNRFGL